MSLADNLDDILKQTSEYKEESSSEKVEDSTNTVNEEKQSVSKEKPKLNKKIVLLASVAAVSVIILSIGGFSAYKYITRDRGTDWMQEMEDGTSSEFEYSIEEREMLRAQGYTADDIERYEVEEADPYELVAQAEEARKKVNDESIKPYLDGASEEFKTLKSLTWIGTGEMSQTILDDVEGSYEEMVGSFNCDYTKVPPYGSQLFLKLVLMDFDNKVIFMDVTPSRYNELSDSGNIVVDLEYYQYSDGNIFVKSVSEKDIRM